MLQILQLLYEYKDSYQFYSYPDVLINDIVNKRTNRQQHLQNLQIDPSSKAMANQKAELKSNARTLG